MNTFYDHGPATLTILPTYRCTAACEQCCFGSNPSIEERLTYQQIVRVITEARDSFSGLRVVVFSGGECTMLGDDLVEAIRLANSFDLVTRIVTNGHWGAGPQKAKSTAAKLASAGLRELNISTGSDHEKFVSLNAVINSAVAATENGIFTLVTVEADSNSTNVLARLTKNSRFAELIALGTNRFRVQTNAWMAFNGNHTPRVSRAVESPKSTPCQQVFNNIVITPHGNVSSCCGLTFEHTPEMRIGNIQSVTLSEAHSAQLNDFIKIWIRVDGPDGIINKIYNNCPPPDMISPDHFCETCALMFKNVEVKNRIRERYIEFYGDVMARFAIQRGLERKFIEFNRSDLVAI